MIEFTPEQIQENWNKLIQLIEDTFEGERKEKLLEMYSHFEDRMCVAPASGQLHFHLCTPGGYVQHILNIVHYSNVENVNCLNTHQDQIVLPILKTLVYT